MEERRWQRFSIKRDKSPESSRSFSKSQEANYMDQFSRQVPQRSTTSALLQVSEERLAFF
jgi:hypothetical protein